jgi:uncharacterized sporulation protein YeaH/YhbH (DUF444 family)
VHAIERDVQRHKERLKDALRAKLPEVVASEDIITAPSGRRLRVPVRYLDDIHFRPARSGAAGGGAGRGPHPGEGHREPTIEVGLTLEELAELLFEELRLPRLRPKPGGTEEDVRVEGVARQGPPARLDKRRTLLEHLKGDGLWREEHLRYRDLSRSPREVNRSVVVFVRDASGSMDVDKRYRVRVAAFWALLWLRRRYSDVSCVFIVHDTAAEEVDEHTFFHVGEMGGTAISSGLTLAEEILESRYPAAEWNRYVLFYSDGENAPSDNERAVVAVTRLHDACELVGYGEVEEYRGYHGILPILSALAGRLPRFRAAVIRREDEVPDWLRAVFGVTDDVA